MIMIIHHRTGRKMIKGAVKPGYNKCVNNSSLGVRMARKMVKMATLKPVAVIIKTATAKTGLRMANDRTDTDKTDTKKTDINKTSSKTANKMVIKRMEMGVQCSMKKTSSRKEKGRALKSTPAI